MPLDLRPVARPIDRTTVEPSPPDPAQVAPRTAAPVRRVAPSRSFGADARAAVVVVARLVLGAVVAAVALLRLRTEALLVFGSLFAATGLSGLIATRARRTARRQVVVVADGHELGAVLRDLPDWEVVGAFGRCERAARTRGVAWFGAVSDLESRIAARLDTRTGATPDLRPDALAAPPPAPVTVVVSNRVMVDDDLRLALARLRRAGHPVVIDAGLRGIDARQLRSLRSRSVVLLALHEDRLPVVRAAAKRALDLVVATTVLVVAAPVMLVAALAVKVSDGGPVLFSQTRVGRAGAPFAIHKFRTMVVDAEQRLTEVAHRNERQGGPLFKLDHDPRVTSVGRFLRATSIDELPQLFDVIAGSMSLVGPRPALPSEAREFDARLTGRHDVRPGITGLWQVEGRDHPSFDAYRRCDVYYVENWSLRLDLAILARTVPTVLGRAWRSVRSARPEAARSGPLGLDDPGWVPSMGLADRGRS